MQTLDNLFGLKGKVAIVTGGNTGIGLGYVDALSRAGANIMVAHFDPEVKKVLKIVKENGQKIAFWKGDLTKENAAQEVLDKTIKTFKRVNILVNNAGATAREPILKHSKDKWNKVMNINLNAVFVLSQVIAKEFAKQGSGKIINIASMRAFQAGIGNPGYTTSKHGILGLTKSFANELGSKNIQVNAIAPGYIISDFTKFNRENPKINNRIVSRIPAGRWGTIEDLKGIVVFLASKASDYINGTTICVDGGFQIR